MDEAAATRRASLDAIDDVEPDELQGRLATQIGDASMVPGVLTIRCARASSDGAAAVTTEDGTLREPLARRAAGVQLVYNGLDHTRALAHDEPWANDGLRRGERVRTDAARTNGGGSHVEPTNEECKNHVGNTNEESTDHVERTNEESDLAILVADVLVARGFYLLARTPAARQAVRTVQAFGRDQTVRRTTGDSRLDANLEADVLELAVVAGSTLGDAGGAPGLREFAVDLADHVTDADGFPATTSFFPDNVDDRLRTVITDSAGNEGVTTSVDD